MAQILTPIEILAKRAALLKDNHFVYTSSLHGEVYVNKDAVFPYAVDVSHLCNELANMFLSEKIDVVVSPAVGAVVLSQGVAFHMTNLSEREVLSTYAERKEVLKAKADQRNVLISIDGKAFYLESGQELVLKDSSFVLKRGFDKLVSGKRVLVIEDILTTGGTVKKVIDAIRSVSGEVVAVGALCNRGEVTAEHLGVPRLTSLIDVKFETWTEEECAISGPCSKHVPVHTTIGKGADFLARTGKS